MHHTADLIARVMGPTGGLPGADRTQVGPMWATWTLLSVWLYDNPLPARSPLLWSDVVNVSNISNFVVWITQKINRFTRMSLNIFSIVKDWSMVNAGKCIYTTPTHLLRHLTVSTTMIFGSWFYWTKCVSGDFQIDITVNLIIFECLWFHSFWYIQFP